MSALRRLSLLSMVMAAIPATCGPTIVRSNAEIQGSAAMCRTGALPRGGKMCPTSPDLAGIATVVASGMTAAALPNFKGIASACGNRDAGKADFVDGRLRDFMHSPTSSVGTSSKSGRAIEHVAFSRLRLNVRSATVRCGRLCSAGQTLPVTYVATGPSATAADRPLRVVTAAIAPFVLPQTDLPDSPGGFSIDLWDEVASRMHVQFVWSLLPTQSDLLRSVQRGDADVAIAAITMTPEREEVVDFSLPYFDSGLQIMVRARNESAFLETFRSIPWRAICELFGVAAILVFLLANLLWLVERKHDRSFQKPYVRALGEGLWGTILIIATGEHGERDAANIWKRMLVPAMWLIGVVLIAQLTATVTSSQTVTQLQSNIQGPGDLPGKAIGTAAGTIAADYLTQRGLPFVDVKTAADGIRMLTEGELQAIVYDAPTLQYWAAKRGNGILMVVGPIFRPEKYGIALTGGSTLRKPINEALLAMYADGTYEKIYGKWFRQGK